MQIGMDSRYEQLEMISWWEQKRIRAARVMVVGAGALGNEVIKNLALLGVGTIVVVDCDSIELSNLCRSVLFRERDCGRAKAEVAAEMAIQMNPDCLIQPVVGRIPDDVGLGLVREMDTVIGCVDNREARLWINRMCYRVGVPWIDGGIQEISGVAKVFAPPGHFAHVPGRGCYECTMTENDYRLIQLRYSCPLLSRDEILQGRVPTAPTISSIIGGLQVQEFLKLLHKIPSASGSGLIFSGPGNHFYQTIYPVREDCLSHESATPLRCWPHGSSALTARELIEFVTASNRESDPASIEVQLDRDFVQAFECDTCNSKEMVQRTSTSVTSDESLCPQCKTTRRPLMIHQVKSESVEADFPLKELGIPEFDIVRVRIGESTDEWIKLQRDCPPWLDNRIVGTDDQGGTDP